MFTEECFAFVIDYQAVVLESSVAYRERAEQLEEEMRSVRQEVASLKKLLDKQATQFAAQRDRDAAIELRQSLARQVAPPKDGFTLHACTHKQIGYRCVATVTYAPDVSADPVSLFFSLLPHCKHLKEWPTAGTNNDVVDR